MSETSEDDQAQLQTSEEELSGEEEQDNTDAEEDDGAENADEQTNNDTEDASEDEKPTNDEKALTWKDLVNSSINPSNLRFLTIFIYLGSKRHTVQGLRGAQMESAFKNSKGSYTCCIAGQGCHWPGRNRLWQDGCLCLTHPALAA